MPVETIAGFPAFWEETGSGDRKVLFIHCTLAHSGSWSGVQGRLLDRLRMRVFDRPGHGKSGDWTGGADAVALHDLTTRIAAALIDGHTDVVGHSFGATIALRLAQEMPDRIRSLTMIEPVLTTAARGHPDYGAYLDGMRRFHQFLADGDRLAAARAFNNMVSPEAPFDELPQKVQDSFARRIHLIRDESGVTLEDATRLLSPGNLEALAQPVLLMEGGKSPALMHHVNDALAARLPQARRVLVAGAGHMAPLTHPQAVAAEIATCLGI
jgi:lipase